MKAGRPTGSAGPSADPGYALHARRTSFAAKAAYWTAYRIRIRLPKPAAALTAQLPLRPIETRSTASRTSAQRIPAVVHQTWSSNAFGRSHRASLARLRDGNPEYDFRLWVEEEIEQYMADRWGDHPVHEIFQRARFGPLKTDIWRYCLLSDVGGVYLDISKALSVPLGRMIGADDRIVLSFDARSTFRPEPGEVLSDSLLVSDRAVSNWLIAAVPHHPVLQHVIDSIVQAYPDYRGASFSRPKDAILEFTGPRRLTHALHRFMVENPGAPVGQRAADFESTAIWELPGSWVRYTDRPAYILASDSVIVD